MAGTLIDQLIVALRLDPQHQFKSDSDTALQTSKKTKEQLTRDAKANAESQKQFKEAIGDVTKAAIGLGAALVGFKGLASFIADQISASAAVGRLAHNLDMATSEVSAWEGVVKQMGGSAADADSSLQSIVSTLQEMQLTGKSSKVPFLQNLGIALQDLKDPTKLLLELADKFQNMDPARAQSMGAGLGLSPAMINTLEQGRSAVEALLKAQREAGVVNDQDAAAAKAAQQQIELLGSTYAALGRNILTAALPGMIAFGQWLSKDAQSPEMKAVLKDTDELGKSFHRLGDALHIKINLDPFKLLLQILDAVLKEVGHVANAMSAVAKGDWKTAGAEAWGALKDSPLGLLFQGKLGGGSTAPAPSVSSSSSSSGGGAVATGRGGLSTVGAAVRDYLIQNGIASGTALGVAAGVTAEGGAPTAFNAAGGGHGAFGIGQWRGARLMALQSFARSQGKSPGDLGVQMAFLLSELKGGDRGGASVLAQGTAQGALSAYIQQFMRAGGGNYGDLSRGRAALRNTGTTIHISGPITVTTNATDARGVAAGLHSALERQAYVASAQSGPV